MTHLRIVGDPDDIDDSMAANPEEPTVLEDLGYGKAERPDPRVTLEPRGPRRAGAPTHWAIVEREGAAPSSSAVVATKVCREPGCGAGGIMHADPRNSYPERVICGKCAGDARRRMT